jgi:putative NIF3 family GTP cyclohydrolase 1 type 2
MPQPLQVVRAYLDRRLCVNEQADLTGNGLLVSGTPEVRRIGAALSTSFAAISSAAAAGVDLLLVHHAPWTTIDLHLRDRKLAAVAAHGISLYAMHESLDQSPTDSTGGSLARTLSLTVQRAGGADLAIAIAPPIAFTDWLSLVATRLRVRVRAWQNNPVFQRIALVPGGGGSTQYLAAALALGCDTFLTGEGSLYTELFAHEVGLSLVYATHGATEFPSVCDFAASVADEMAVSFVTIPDPPWISGGGRAPLEVG